MYFAATSNSSGSLTPILLIVAAGLLIYFLFQRPMRRRQQAARDAHANVLANLAKGTKIVTVGGLHATVISTNDDESVTVEISPGVTARYDRQAVAKVLPDDTPDPASAYDEDEDVIDGADLDAAHSADDTDHDSATDGPATGGAGTDGARPDGAGPDGSDTDKAPKSITDKSD